MEEEKERQARRGKRIEENKKEKRGSLEEGEGSAGQPVRQESRRSRGVDAGTQADNELRDWASYDLGRALRVLQSRDETAVKMALRRLHIRFWHASTARMTEILKAAGVPAETLKLIKPVVDTCRTCRIWAKPAPNASAPSRMAS